jgi:hypothetical protein
MRFPLSALINPVLDQLYLGRRQLVPGINWRHSHGLVRIADALVHLAPGRISRHNYPLLRECPILRIEVQASHSMFVIGAVAGKAII